VEIDVTSSRVSTGSTESELTPKAMLARARALRPRLIAEQAATEERNTYSPQMHEEFVKAGFYKLYIPRRFGGHEFDFTTFIRLTIELGRGCPSTSWCFSLGAAHALQLASYWDERAQTEIFGSVDHFAMASSAQPIGVAQRTDEGWVLNGKASYCSGIPYSSHYMGQALMGPPAASGPPSLLLFIAPKSGFTILDDWGDLIGLKGSGSNSVTFQGAVIPHHWALENIFLPDMDVSKGTPGLKLHNNPLYAGRGFGTFTGNLAAVGVGAAYNALDEYERMLDSKTILPPFSARRHDGDYQRWFGSAMARIGMAEAALLSVADQHMEACEMLVKEGKNYTYLDDARHAAIAREVLIECWEVIQSVLWRTAGSSAGAKGQRLERIFRDMATASGHRNVTLRDYFHRELAQSHLNFAGGRPQADITSLRR
jgi:3-hydroxy-9,10-secoandrosta-1,3,5(10)-triene-9,17-dione monooxygenase